MNGNIKRYIYIIGTVFILFLVGIILFKILPVLILAGVIVYFIAKIVGTIKAKKEQKDFQKSDFNNNSNSEEDYNLSADEYTNGEIIDVDYEEVKKK